MKVGFIGFGEAAYNISLGLGSEMTEAAKKKLELLEPYGFAKRYVEKKPEGWRDIINGMKEK